MSGEFLDNQRHASEERLLRRKNRELLGNRTAAADAHAKSELSARTGLTDPALIAELGSLGFTPTISVLPLMPIVQMAWAEGGIRQRSATCSSASPADAALPPAAPPISCSATGWRGGRPTRRSRGRRGWSPPCSTRAQPAKAR